MFLLLRSHQKTRFPFYVKAGFRFLSLEAILKQIQSQQQVTFWSLFMLLTPEGQPSDPGAHMRLRFPTSQSQTSL